LALTVAVADNS